MFTRDLQNDPSCVSVDATSFLRILADIKAIIKEARSAACAGINAVQINHVVFPDSEIWHTRVPNLSCSHFRQSSLSANSIDDGKGGKLLFKSFFDPDGSPMAEAVRQFFSNLGVAKAASDGNVAEGASPAGEEPPKEGASA